MRQRERKCFMVDFRLIERISKKAKQSGRSESDELNDMLWAAVLNGRNMSEKQEILRDFENFSDLVKTFIERSL